MHVCIVATNLMEVLLRSQMLLKIKSNVRRELFSLSNNNNEEQGATLHVISNFTDLNRNLNHILENNVLDASLRSLVQEQIEENIKAVKSRILDNFIGNQEMNNDRILELERKNKQLEQKVESMAAWMTESLELTNVDEEPWVEKNDDEFSAVELSGRGEKDADGRYPNDEEGNSRPFSRYYESSPVLGRKLSINLGGGVDGGGGGGMVKGGKRGSTLAPLDVEQETSSSSLKMPNSGYRKGSIAQAVFGKLLSLINKGDETSVAAKTDPPIDDVEAGANSIQNLFAADSEAKGFEMVNPIVGNNGHFPATTISKSPAPRKRSSTASPRTDFVTINPLLQKAFKMSELPVTSSSAYLGDTNGNHSSSPPPPPSSSPSSPRSPLSRSRSTLSPVSTLNGALAIQALIKTDDVDKSRLGLATRRMSAISQASSDGFVNPLVQSLATSLGDSSTKHFNSRRASLNSFPTPSSTSINKSQLRKSPTGNGLPVFK